MAKTSYSVFQKAIKLYGKDEQMRMAQEECAELIQAVNKIHRAENNSNVKEYGKACDNIIEEIADVEIMCAQLRIIMNNSAAVNAVKVSKIKRLEERMNKYDRK
jgi:NTP pyrophosphatase (non-canonical NTP hydrolase)